MARAIIIVLAKKNEPMAQARILTGQVGEVSANVANLNLGRILQRKGLRQPAAALFGNVWTFSSTKKLRRTV